MCPTACSHFDPLWTVAIMADSAIVAKHAKHTQFTLERETRDITYSSTTKHVLHWPIANSCYWS